MGKFLVLLFFVALVAGIVRWLLSFRKNQDEQEPKTKKIDRGVGKYID